MECTAQTYKRKSSAAPFRMTSRDIRTHESATWDANAVNGMLDPAARDMAIMGATIVRIASLRAASRFSRGLVMTRGSIQLKNKNAGLIIQAGVLLL
jgi:hypothetical protein